jgi:hypothetical protein
MQHLVRHVQRGSGASTTAYEDRQQLPDGQHGRTQSP